MHSVTHPASYFRTIYLWRHAILGDPAAARILAPVVAPVASENESHLSDLHPFCGPKSPGPHNDHDLDGLPDYCDRDDDNDGDPDAIDPAPRNASVTASTPAPIGLAPLGVPVIGAVLDTYAR